MTSQQSNYSQTGHLGVTSNTVNATMHTSFVNWTFNNTKDNPAGTIHYVRDGLLDFEPYTGY